MNENHHILPLLNRFGITLALLLFIPTLIYGLEVTLEWDANTESDLAGYKLYYKQGSSGPPYDGTGLIYNGHIVTSPIDAGNTTHITLSNISPQNDYFFVVTAYDNETPSLESGYSNIAAFYANTLIKGDVNNDGFIDSGDAILILRYESGLITLTANEKWCGNVTNKSSDDDIDSNDAQKILEYFAGLITSLN